MKQLTDADLEKMVDGTIIPVDKHTARQVRSELRLDQRIPKKPTVPEHVILDLHQKTEEQAWAEINALLISGAAKAKIITGASGILKIKFQDWITNGTLVDKIATWKLINNGCYEIKIKKKSINKF